jgi:glycosyltransferase involved in cell wall biosynthesis
MPHFKLVPHQFLRSFLEAGGFKVDGTIPNFIELEKYKYRERSSLAPRFLYLRGMHPFYNAPMALRAFSIVQKQWPDASLTMAGAPGSESAQCEGIIRDCGLSNVRFTGIVPKDRIPELADAHDIHLHANRVENMPVSIIEMWACGLPIIGTAVGGMVHLARSGSDSILVNSDDHAAMAEACLRLLSDRELARTLSRNGRARAEELSWEKVKPAWESVLLNGTVEAIHDAA